MRKDWVLTKEVFEAFLSWLSPDREEAAVKYEKIREKLIAFFEFKGCDIAESLTDETINRVSERLFRAETTGETFPLQFIYGTARIVHLEFTAKPTDFSLEEDVDSAVSENQNESYFSGEERECIKLCFEELNEENSKLIISYFQISGKTKLAEREKLAVKHGETLNALRVRISRIRQKLQKCQKNCLNRKK